MVVNLCHLVFCLCVFAFIDICGWLDHSHYKDGMYGGTLLFWDWICGTDIPYKKYIAEKKRNKTKQK